MCTTYRYCLAFLVFALLVLTGCKEEEGYRNHIAKPVLTTADQFISSIQNNDTTTASALLIPEIRGPKGDAIIQHAVESLRSDPIVSTPPYQIVFYNVGGEIYGAHHEITYQIRREKGWLLVNVSVEDFYKRAFGVTAVDFRYIPIPLETLNAFSFNGKPWKKYYTVLAGCAALILLSGYCLWLLLHTKTRKTWIKYVWLFFILIGFARVDFNWTSGEFSFVPATSNPSVLYHLGMVVKVEHNSPYEPWHIQFLFPLGALLFLLRRKSLIERAEEEEKLSGMKP